MICRQKLYHFMVANLVLPWRVSGAVKRVFATVKWYNFCLQIILSQTFYLITMTIMNILMKWSYNETFVFIFLLRWHFYPTTNVFLSMLFFYIWTNVNTKELMQFQYDTDTSITVNNYGLLEIKGETRWLGMSMCMCGLSEHAMNASDTENVIGNRCTK